MPHITIKKRTSPIVEACRRGEGPLRRLIVARLFGRLPGPPGRTRRALLEPTAAMRETIACFVATAAFMLVSLCLTLAPAKAAQHPVAATPTTIAVYATVLRHFNPQMPAWQSRDLARRVLISAERWRLDTNMLIAIVSVESSWRTHAVSSAGAIGLGQLMPGTAALLRVNPHDPTQNIAGAARYLRGLMQRFGSRHYNLVFAAYNAGPHAVSEYGGIPPYEETEAYVVRVLDTWEHLEKTVHLPADAYAVRLPAHGLDIDYWLDASSYQP
jgi:soluble lytic murein transglycosylase-like protein